MSKKKKNIRRKKSNNLLKGVAAAGAVVGGGTIFAGNNAVYAAENEQDAILTKEKQEELLEKQSVSESTTESLSNNTSNQGNFNLGQSIFKSAAEPEVAMVADTGEDTSETTIDGTQYANEDPVEEDASDTTGDTTTFEGNTTTETGQQDESNSPSNNNEDDESVSASQSVSDFIKYSEAVKAESLNIAVSESLSNSLASNSTTLNDPLSNIGSDSYASSLKDDMDSYNEKYSQIISEYNSEMVVIDKNNAFLETLYGKINDQMKEVKNAYNYAYNNNKSLWDAGFYSKADILTNLFAQYFIYQQEGVKDVTSSDWSNENKENNFVKTKYIDSNGQTQIAYFDYVIANTNGQRVDNKDDFGPNKTWNWGWKGSWKSDYSYNKITIQVLKKSPIYTDGNGTNSSTFYYADHYVKNENNKVVQQRTYYLNGLKTSQDTIIKYLGDNKYEVTYKERDEWITKTFTMDENNPTFATIDKTNAENGYVGETGQDRKSVV